MLFTSAAMSAIQFSSVENSSSWFTKIPDVGIGRAINDRLIKASHKWIKK